MYLLLYSAGIGEIAEHDTRSGVLNVYSAWDSFVAQTVEAILEQSEVAPDFPSTLRRSEPMLGMFAALFATKTRRFPTVVSSAVTEIRNKVAHGEFIPSTDEAIKVANAVRAAINDALDTLGMEGLEHYRGPRQRQDIQRGLRELEAKRPRVDLGQLYYGGNELRIEAADAVKAARERWRHWAFSPYVE